MAIEIDIAVEAGEWGGEARLRACADRAVAAAAALLALAGESELSVVFTDDGAIRALNTRWRSKDKATNVLSFPAFETGRRAPLPPMLGDIVVACETVFREAALEGKPFEHHLSHLIVHGFLHLLGYDHENDADAEEMEGLERRILSALAIPDPYMSNMQGQTGQER